MEGRVKILWPGPPPWAKEPGMCFPVICLEWGRGHGFEREQANAWLSQGPQQHQMELAFSKTAAGQQVKVNKGLPSAGSS